MPSFTFNPYQVGLLVQNFWVELQDVKLKVQISDSQTSTSIINPPPTKFLTWQVHYGQGICISNKLPGDANVAGSETTLAIWSLSIFQTDIHANEWAWRCSKWREILKCCLLGAFQRILEWSPSNCRICVNNTTSHSLQTGKKGQELCLMLGDKSASRAGTKNQNSRLLIPLARCVLTYAGPLAILHHIE